ncbi:ABC transporter permease [Dactylosporangium sp. NPDC000555]|uniref:ABC transporter permease n=1 Tax=Dactylosporangium sp. NPDC000555 TaxID=3154260 RepID=UPI003327D8A9
MLRFAGKRLLAAVPLLFIVPFLVFALINFAPGDPAYALAGDNPTPERIAMIRHNLGLDEPMFARYGQWVWSAMHGDLGVSFIADQNVTDLILRRASTTVSLVVVAMVIAVVFGMLFAILASLRPNGIFDRIVNWVSSIAIAVPAFWFGIVLASLFTVSLRLFPAFGYRPLADGFGTWLSFLVLPGLALGLLPAAEVALQLRSSLGTVLKSDYILNAEARGLSRLSVVLKHALKNAAVPVVTVLGFRVSEVLAGSVTLEIIYNMPGLGRLAVDSVLARDVPVLLGFVLFSTTIVVLVNLLVDISYGYFNPKVRT